MARVALTGTGFGVGPVSLKCGNYKVQLKTGPKTWVDVPVVTWTETRIECVLPSRGLEPGAWHKIRVKTPTGNSNKRDFKVLPIPTIDRIEDDTENDAQGREGGWLTVYTKSQGERGILGGGRREWHEDSLDADCMKFFGTKYVVSFTSVANRFCARVCDEWNISGNQDSFKVWIDDWWLDIDGDYKQDADEPRYGSGHLQQIPPDRYSVQVCLIVYSDTNDDDRFSGDGDTIHQFVKSQPGIIYETIADPVITELVPDSIPASQPGCPQFVEIKGRHFGDAQRDSSIHVGKKIWTEEHPKIKLWSDTLIKFKVPNSTPPFPKSKKVWITVREMDSTKKRLEVVTPAACQ
jgi:hypothetical protein